MIKYCESMNGNVFLIYQAIGKFAEEYVVTEQKSFSDSRNFFDAFT